MKLRTAWFSEIASESGSLADWQIYCKLRNNVTKMNRKKKKCYYQTRINEVRTDSKQLWKTFNNALGRGSNRASSFIEVDGAFITKPFDIAQYFNDFFTSKLDRLRRDVSCNYVHHVSSISDTIMKSKVCMFGFDPLAVRRWRNFYSQYTVTNLQAWTTWMASY